MGLVPSVRECGFGLMKRFREWSKLVEELHPDKSAKLELFCAALGRDLGCGGVREYEDVLSYILVAYKTLDCKSHARCRRCSNRLDMIYEPVKFMVQEKQNRERHHHV